jgi:hypothetical protein
MVEAKARAAVARVTVTEAARKRGAETVVGVATVAMVHPRLHPRRIALYPRRR